MRSSRWTNVLAAGLALAACQTDHPTSPSASNGAPRQFEVTSANYAAARAATDNRTKLFYQQAIARQKYLGNRASANIVQSPFDLTYNGGPVVTKATSWNLYINCNAVISSGGPSGGPAECWSTLDLTPVQFIQDYDHSGLLQVLSQYLHEDPNGRFGNVNTMVSNTVQLVPDSITGEPQMTMNILLAVLHAASQATTKSGYDQIYHVFIPKGIEMCVTPDSCYSPENPPTFQFCAFHGSVNFGPHWHVLYTMEPYQLVAGCVGPNQPRLIDATASTLSHELAETITDPDLNAWFNDLTGNEIADLCFTFRNPEQIGGDQFVVQEEYSNIVHACTDGAF